jgi:hypothetical protein
MMKNKKGKIPTSKKNKKNNYGLIADRKESHTSNLKE